MDNLEITQEFDNFGIERQDISRNSIDSAFAKTTESDVNETKPQNIDSDFVSEDYCSSPETGVTTTVKDNIQSNDQVYRYLLSTCSITILSGTE